MLGSQHALAQTPASATGTRGGDERGALRLGSGDDVDLSLGGYVQVDGRWLSGARSRQPDGMLLRRARLVFDAAMANGWHLRLQPDFGQGRVLVQDAFAGREDSRMIVRDGGIAEVQAGVLAGRERGTDESPALSRILSVARQPILTFQDDGTAAGTVVAAGARRRSRGMGRRIPRAHCT